MGRGQIGYWGISTIDTIAERKRVVFRPATAADTVRVGDLVCYNSDLAADWKELTSNRLSGDFGGENATAYAEGAQTYNGRFLVVEKGASGNLEAWAGVVAVLGPKKGADGDILEVWVPKEGAVVPVYTNANCTLDATVLGVASGSYLAQVVTGDGDPLPIGVAVETVNRSSTNGLVWCRLFGNAGIGVQAGYFAPVRAVATGDAYGVRMDLTSLFVSSGATGPRTWGLGITGDRESGYALITGGCDDAALRITINNYAANEEIFNWRGINVVASNRSGGTVGELSNIISVSAKSGSINAKIVACYIDAQSLSADTADVMYGLDIALNREGGVSTEEAGINIRTRGTINTAVNTALRISKDATDHGFINLFNIETDAVDVIAASGDITFTSADKLIPIVFNGTTYYLVATDNV